MRLIAGLLGGLFLLGTLGTIPCCIRQPQTAMTDTNRVDRLAEYTVALQHTNNGHTQSMCTGTFISPHVILTAYHCVSGLSERLGKEELLLSMEGKNEEEKEMLGMALMLGLVEVPAVDLMTANFDYSVREDYVDVGKAPVRNYQTRVRVLSKKFDLALLDTVGTEPMHGVAILAAHNPLIGERVFAIGSPLAVDWTYMNGMVAGYRTDMEAVGMETDGEFMQVQMPLWHGNSGGGVFDAEGKYVGMADFISPAPDMGFCVDLETVRGYLAGQHLISLDLK